MSNAKFLILFLFILIIIIVISFSVWFVLNNESNSATQTTTTTTKTSTSTSTTTSTTSTETSLAGDNKTILANNAFNLTIIKDIDGLLQMDYNTTSVAGNWTFTRISGTTNVYKIQMIGHPNPDCNNKYMSTLNLTGTYSAPVCNIRVKKVANAINTYTFEDTVDATKSLFYLNAYGVKFIFGSNVTSNNLFTIS